MVLELQRTDRVCHPFDRIALAMCEIIHRVNAPLVTRTVMRRTENAIHHRIAEIQIIGGHIDLGPQCPASVREFAFPHPTE